MSPETQDRSRYQESNGGSYLWLAGAVGAAAGIAVLAYTRRKETAWEKARRRALEFAETARDRASDVELKPWMGVAAGAAAGTAGLAAYKMRRKSPGGVVQQRAEDVAERVTDTIQPWLTYAAKAVLAAAAMARDEKQRRRAIDTVSEGASDAAGQVAETGMRLLRRVQQLSGETRKLYPSIRRLIA